MLGPTCMQVTRRSSPPPSVGILYIVCLSQVLPSTFFLISITPRLPRRVSLQTSINWQYSHFIKMANPKIRIAIIGGGLAGASLANALVRHVQLEFHVYESAPEFSERGAGISLSITAQRALEHINPATPELLRKAGAVAQKSSRNMIVRSTP